ncbi:MAG: VTT domain-containing protein [Deltaproteobacteria bacterium]|nr:VTT domain-containing protein [Deltaproteobacteria bacterium]
MTQLTEILIRHGYLVLFLAVLGEQLALPLPAGLFLFAAGALAGEGQLNLAVAFFLAVLACLLSDNLWYQVGRRKGRSVLPYLCRISLNPDSCLRRTQNIFARYGAKALLVVKFFPGVNPIAAPLSGILQMRPYRFVLFDSLGAFIWIGLFMGLGYLLSNQIEEWTAYASRIGVFLWVVLIGLIGYIAWKVAQRHRFLNRLRMARITPEELKRKIDAAEDLLIIDVRSSLEFEADPQRIPGALYLPLEELLKNPPEFPRAREVILYCDCPNEASSAQAAFMLKKKGLKNVRPLAGGFMAWRQRDYPLESGTPLNNSGLFPLAE